jgi:shikimate kinase
VLHANVVLTGFMGTGKTTVGRLLAERLGFEFVDTDAIIEERHGPIGEIFAERGEDAFREIERDLARELADRHHLVISTGGRMMLDPANAEALARNGRVFCLVASPDEIHRRVVDDPSRIERPLLSVPDPLARIVELLAEREPHYRHFPQLSTDDRSPESIVAQLADLVRRVP